MHCLHAVAGATRHLSLYLNRRFKPRITVLLSLKRLVLVLVEWLFAALGVRSLPWVRASHHRCPAARHSQSCSLRAFAVAPGSVTSFGIGGNTDLGDGSCLKPPRCGPVVVPARLWLLLEVCLDLDFPAFFWIFTHRGHGGVKVMGIKGEGSTTVCES